MALGLFESTLNLEGKHLVLQLADGPGLLEAEALSGLLQATDHGRRAAQQDLDVLGRLGQVFLLQPVSNGSPTIKLIILVVHT